MGAGPQWSGTSLARGELIMPAVSAQGQRGGSGRQGCQHPWRGRRKVGLPRKPPDPSFRGTSERSEAPPVAPSALMFVAGA